MSQLPPKVVNELARIQAGVDIIVNEIKYGDNTAEELLVLQERAMQLLRAYRVLRSEYDVLYFAYEYFSEDRNAGNDDNLIPAGTKYENAPNFHRILCGKLDELHFKPTKKIGWSVPRGHGKSAYLSNVFPVHQIVFNKRKYILIISETGAISQKFVEWVSGQLKYNKKLIEDFGVFLHESKALNEKDNLELFVTTNGIMVQSSSLGKQLRGARNGSFRPDLVILDDLESAKNTGTRELREKNLHWYNSVVAPVGDVTRTSFIYMGTLVSGKGLLPNVLSRSDYDSAIYSAIVSEPVRTDLWNKVEEILRDVDNPNREMEADNFYYEHKEEMDEGARTLWNERFTYYDLLKVKINIGSRAFASEYLNVASDAESCVFKSEYFEFYNESEVYSPAFMRQLDLFSFWDIAIGKNSRSDYNAIITIGRHRTTGIIYVIDSFVAKLPMHKALEVAVQKIKQYRPKVFGVETVQAQYDMYRQLRERCIKDGLYSTRVLAYNPKGSKESRIEMLEPLVEQGAIRFNKNHRLLLEQLELFGGGADHDDACDALASAVDIAGKQRKRMYYKKPAGF